VMKTVYIKKIKHGKLPWLLYKIGTRKDIKSIAANVFKGLRYLDECNECEIILAETFPLKDMGVAVMNRLAKAASCRMIFSLNDLVKFKIIDHLT